LIKNLTRTRFFDRLKNKLFKLLYFKQVRPVLAINLAMGIQYVYCMMHGQIGGKEKTHKLGIKHIYVKNRGNVKNRGK